MRIMVALENRFYKCPNGRIYSSTICDYSFWERYLQSFEEVVVFARVGLSDQPMDNKCPANGPGVRFFELPMYIGPRQYLIQRNKIQKLAKKAVSQADAFILRIPGTIGTILWKQLKKKGLPYGVEVVGSSFDSLRTSNISPLIQSFLYLWQCVVQFQRRQCAGASAAAYVTQQYLQKLYPPGGWNTNYSTINLNEECLATDEELEARNRFLEEAISGQRPFRICHAASMEARYKAQDILIRAVATCRRQGVDVELFFLGDGKYKSYYESIARQAGVEPYVKFLGRIPSGKPVQDQMDRADIFVFPSLTEGLPKVLIEAMARGLPCLGSQVGGIPELLEEDFLVQAGSVEALANKLLFLLRTPEVLTKVSRRNRLKAHEYLASVLNPRRIMMYQTLIKCSQRLRNELK